MNKIILCGNICKDVELKYYADKKVVKNTIAVRRDYKNKNGEYDSDFLNFSVWGNQAEYLAQYSKKGDKILICGKLLNNNYEKEGQTIYSNDIQVENIEIISQRKKENEELSNEDVIQKVKDTLGDDVAIEISENLLD